MDRILRAPGRPKLDDAPSLGFEHHAGETGLMLDLGLRGGDRVGLSYYDLRTARLDPSDAITLEFSNHLVTIRGRNLLALYNNLLTHTVWRINVADTNFDDGTTGTWIEAIEVAERQSSATS